MFFHISGFTHIGSIRKSNEDRILIQDRVCETGIIHFENELKCFCFVADGIGGGPRGDLASKFVLEQILQRIDRNSLLSQGELENVLREINTALLEKGTAEPAYYGTGTTLVGLVIDDNGQFQIVNVGDSVAYVFRNDTSIKISEDQVLNPFEHNSPLVSYFGGKQDSINIELDTVLRKIQCGDILMLSSDGLLKALDIKQVKAIASNSKPLSVKAKFILEESLKKGAEDNVSCILVEVM